VIKEIVQKLRRAAKLDIVKVFSFTSVSTLVKMIAGFVSVKVVAVIIGPAGVALVRQLGNFSSLIMSIATGGIGSGVTKYIAQYREDEDEVKKYTGTAVKITLFFSVFCGIFLVCGAPLLSEKILLDRKYTFVFIVFGITLIFYTANSLLMAVINGYKQFNLYVKISIISSVIGLGLSLLLVIPFGVNGALLNAVTSQSFIFFITIILAKQAGIICLSRQYVWNRFDKTKATQFFRFALMTLVSGIIGPVSQLIIRGYIIDNFSLQSAGLWEGLNRLSNMYLMIITSSFGVYYLPKLSELSSGTEIKREIKTAYKVIIPCMAAGLSVVYFGRRLIIGILFSPEFYEMSDLFFWRLIGDFLKISSWLIAFLMVAKSMTKLFIATEIGSVISGIALTLWLGRLLGLQGIVLAYAVNFALYTAVMWWKVYKGITEAS
jgi:PST family polysaccharide transporter